MKFRCILYVMAVLLASCGSSPAVSGLLGLDAALDGAIEDIESKLPKGTPVVVTAITAPQHDAREFLGEELSSRFKNLDTLAREAALSAVEREQDFQMSGLVSDDSAVSIGHFIGAKAVISGDLKPFADFTQLRLRVVDVETSKAFIYSARINNKDRLLANIMPPAAAASSTSATKVTDNALAHLNRGNDLLAEKKYGEAIQEFDQAIAINGKFAEAYRGRGIAYLWKSNNDRALMEFNEAIRLKRNYAEAYFGRGQVYYSTGLEKSNYSKANITSASIADVDLAVADFTSAIRINPNYVEAYYYRSLQYEFKKDIDLAITDLNSAIRINPNYENAFSMRGVIYANKGDHDRAIADFTQAIRIKPDNDWAYNARGSQYRRKGDHDRAIADFTQAMRIKPDSADHYRRRADAYEEIGDIDRAIADYEAAVRLGYGFLQSTIDRLKQQRR